MSKNKSETRSVDDTLLWFLIVTGVFSLTSLVLSLFGQYDSVIERSAEVIAMLAWAFYLLDLLVGDVFRLDNPAEIEVH